MEMSDADQETMTEWLATKGALGPCRCGTNDWQDSPNVFALFETNRVGHIDLSSPILAGVVQIWCPNCARVEFFSAKQMGLVG
jgi:hypothetical protein